ARRRMREQPPGAGSKDSAPSCRYAKNVARSLGFLLTPEPPSRRVGIFVAVGLVALCTLLVYPLKQAAPVVSLGVVYMLAVVIVSVTWGLWLGSLLRSRARSPSTTSICHRPG